MLLTSTVFQSFPIDKLLLSHFIYNLKSIIWRSRSRDLIYTEERCWLKRKYYLTILKKYMSPGFPG